jgi:hypothetical protein
MPRRLDSLTVEGSYALNAVNETPVMIGASSEARLAYVVNPCATLPAYPESTFVGPSGTLTLDRNNQARTFQISFAVLKRCGPSSGQSMTQFNGGYLIITPKGDSILLRQPVTNPNGFVDYPGSARASGKNFTLLGNGDTLMIADTLRFLFNATIPTAFTLRYAKP